jgi:hypothetical protein
MTAQVLLFGRMRTQTTVEFDQFWTLYPRREAKAAAVKMWRKLKLEERVAALAALPKHVDYWQRSGRERERIPHAATWLNPVDGRRWEDELPGDAIADPARLARLAEALR